MTRAPQPAAPTLSLTDRGVVESSPVDVDVAVEAAVARWWAHRRHRAGEFSVPALRAVKDDALVTVIVPVKECADTIGSMLERTVAPLAADGLVDELVVVDAASSDGTARIAATHGARVVQQDEIAAELGPALGKGDAMWRALQVTQGDVVCFLDGDTRDPDPAHLLGLIGPLLSDPSVALVKGTFERPLDIGRTTLAHEGGRVTEIMARPLINLYEPLLAGFSQPLAGEFAGRRDLLEEIPFPVGYGVEIAVLVDALRSRGLQALAECHLGTRQNRHQSLRALGEMAYAVLAAVQRRLPEQAIGSRPPATEPTGRYLRPWNGGEVGAVPILERPPIARRRAANGSA